jgi:hypothetical protein
MTIVTTIAVAVLVLGALPALANGKPGAHGDEGRDFGDRVSTAATSGPGAVAEHVLEQLGVGEGGGEGEPYGALIVDGFGPYGGLVSAFAQGGFEEPHDFPPAVGAKAFWTVHGVLLVAL